MLIGNQSSYHCIEPSAGVGSIVAVPEVGCSFSISCVGTALSSRPTPGSNARATCSGRARSWPSRWCRPAADRIGADAAAPLPAAPVQPV
jgi:hypothetical protein